MKKEPITVTAARAEMPEKLAKAWASAQGATKARNAAASNELLIYDMIGYDWWTGGGVTPGQVNAFIDGLPKDTTEIVVRINSPGGNVFDGIAIYNALVNSGKRIVVKIDALAASIASVVAMAGDEIEMAGNAQMFVHKAWSIAMGNADDFLKEAAALESIDGSLVATYTARTGQSAEAIGQMMGDETWLNAEAAKEKGFADSITTLKNPPAAPEVDPPAPDAKARMNILRQKAQLRSRQAALAAA
jgi:ATP-dependent protease ClpP protease subunit